ncbi:MAG: RNA methyltransferase, partial [Clostridia bacterium]|nr:RNA methyltransferase [Clostridia bacterium]
MIYISASSNSKVKRIKSLEQKKGRLKYGEYIIEGIKN